MKRFLLFSLLISILALGIGCAANSSQALPTSAPAQPPPPAMTYDEVPASEASGGAANQPKTLPGQAPGGNDNSLADDTRMIVYTGALSLQVNDTAETVTKITDLLKTVNGYIATKSLVEYDKDKLRGTITVRIPAAALETTLAQIKALGVRVLKETANSNDVTAEYVDLDARRKNLEAYEVELQKLLETVRESTGKAEDILAVYNQLTQVRGEIEQIKGRQRYLENTSTLATYTIEFVPVEQVVVEGKPGWDPGNTAGHALDRLVVALQALGDVAINVTLFLLPLLLIFVVPIVVVILVLRALMKRRTPKKAITTG
jgi:Domain of unknown function (DUF4349)